jgi:hypothetical protein
VPRGTKLPCSAQGGKSLTLLQGLLGSSFADVLLHATSLVATHVCERPVHRCSSVTEPIIDITLFVSQGKPPGNLSFVRTAVESTHSRERSVHRAFSATRRTLLRHVACVKEENQHSCQIRQNPRIHAFIPRPIHPARRADAHFARGKRVLPGPSAHRTLGIAAAPPLPATRPLRSGAVPGRE